MKLKLLTVEDNLTDTDIYYLINIVGSKGEDTAVELYKVNTGGLPLGDYFALKGDVDKPQLIAELLVTSRGCVDIRYKGVIHTCGVGGWLDFLMAMGMLHDVIGSPDDYESFEVDLNEFSSKTTTEEKSESDGTESLSRNFIEFLEFLEASFREIESDVGVDRVSKPESSGVWMAPKPPKPELSSRYVLSRFHTLTSGKQTVLAHHLAELLGGWHIDGILELMDADDEIVHKKLIEPLGQWLTLKEEDVPPHKREHLSVVSQLLT